ncbi:MAG TPA: carboxylesterase family protein [Pseudomonadales bacterium]|nr:carboxylesterase family protein [Pseudomonadales bacterium]
MRVRHRWPKPPGWKPAPEEPKLPPRARLSYGTVRGTLNGNVYKFLGIPYAAAPVGDLRWQPPQPPTPWTGERECFEFGKSAMQNSSGALGDMIGIAAGPIDEDCLTLNVWTRGLTDDERPVFVWIHGGGNVVGSSAQPRFDGSYWVERGDIVCVTINYRLGAFGFLHSPELGASGNEALFDQIAALKWVRKEIRKFGGNPKHITVAGQSAGGFDIAQLMGMDAAAGCFDQILLMSGSLSPQIPRFEAHETAARFAEHFGGWDALRATPARQILEYQQRLMSGTEGSPVRFGPVLDGVTIKADPSGAIAAGTHTRGMPMLIGTTRDEFGLWTGMDPALQALDLAGLEKLAQRLFGERAREGIEVYRAARAARNLECSPVGLWRAMMTDSMFRIPAIRTAEMHSKHTAATYVYQFEYQSPALDGKLGACHSLDVPFIFGTTDQVAQFCGDTHLVRCLAECLHDSFVSFVACGTPQNVMYDWPAWESHRRITMRHNMRSVLESAPMDAERKFWVSLHGRAA